MWEPRPSPEAAPESPSLWRRAPAWRRLSVAATLLTAAAIAVPFILRPAGPDAVSSLAQPAAAQAGSGPAGAAASGETGSSEACLLVQAPSPVFFGSGTVVSLEDRALALKHTRESEARKGGLIDPAYLANQRVVVRLPNGRYDVFVVPRNMQVSPGDRVTLQGGYRNVNLPCNYVPNLVTSDVGPSSDLPSAPTPGAPR